MAWHSPVSSSSVRKTKPFAVPGRWRTMTAPAARDARAVAASSRARAAERMPRRAEAPRAGARPGADPSSSASTGSRRAVSSSGGHLGQRRRVVRGTSGEERAGRARDLRHLPERAPAASARTTPALPRRRARTSSSSRSSRTAARGRPRRVNGPTPCSVSIRRPVACLQSLARTQSPSRTVPLLPPALPSGSRHVDRPHLGAVALRVLDERRRVVEAHRPRVEQRRVERRRMMRLEVRARVRDQREARRVRLRETRRARTT